MGGGAPLAFLNKKTWHPGRMQNLEEVWKREQEAAAEQRKLEELRKQYEDERKNAEFTQMAEAAGFKKDSRLDWMYAGSLAAKHEAQARQDAASAAGPSSSAAAAAAGVPTALEKQQQQEAPLMGKQPAPEEQLSRAEQAAMLPSFMAAGAPTSQNEQWARMTNDPLLAIKQQEQEALKRVKQNPIKMQQILKEVEKVRSHKQKKEKKEKKDKKDKKDRKQDKEHHSSRKRSRSRSRSLSPPPRMPPPAHRGPQLHRDSRDARAGPGDSRGGGRGAFDAGRDADREYGSGRQDDRLQQGHSCREGSGRQRSRSRSRDRDDRQRRSDPRSDSRQQHNGSSRHDDREQQRHSCGREQERSGRQHDERGDRGPHSHHHHNSSSRDGERRAGYGLDAARAHAAGGSAMAAEAAARAEATRQRLAEAAAAKEAAAAAERAARAAGPREAYRTGKLTAEEKAARLAAMMGNADEHEAQRKARLAKARAEEDAERQAGVSGLLAKAAAVRAEDAFKSAAAAEVFGSMSGGGMGLDARINSRRHYNQR